LSNLEDPKHDIDATRATTRLPGLDIGIVHRRSPGGDAEQISINLQAVPTFEALGRFIENFSNPFAFWAMMAWLPWLAAAHVGALRADIAPALQAKDPDSHPNEALPDR
jgi:hypothetical protein